MNADKKRMLKMTDVPPMKHTFVVCYTVSIESRANEAYIDKALTDASASACGSLSPFKVDSISIRPVK